MNAPTLRLFVLLCATSLAACGGGTSTPKDAGTIAEDAGAEPSCTDGAKNGGETGTDCGGPCDACAAGEGCAAAADCASGQCEDQVCVECDSASDCPGEDSACATRTCEAGVCGVSQAPAGTVAGPQSSGDCQRQVCDGQGQLVTETDDTDVPVDNLACTEDVCTAGVPSNPPAAQGSACAQGGGRLCDGAGVCVQCLAVSDCPGQDTACYTRTCNQGLCGFTNAPEGTPVGTQTPGDCQATVCNGQGQIAVVTDDADVPVDGLGCTDDVCSSGTPSHPPSAQGVACNESGGNVCDGQGACVQCLTAQDCPGQDTACEVRTCTAGMCGVAFLSAGTPATQQTAGDCQAQVCDGQGALVSQADNADLPDDGNACTADACVAGAPQHADEPPGALCADNGGNVCDGTGTCVGCLAAADCPGQDTECATRTCTNNTCGATYAPAGTVLVTQTPGDCSEASCDGQGGILQSALDSDLPVDALQCTQDVCTSGAPSNPPVAEGTACTQGGNVCDGQGGCGYTIVVARVGDGTGSLASGTATPVFLEERYLSGALVTTGLNPLPLPTAASGAHRPFALSGTATSEGQLGRSADGAYLVIAGYAAAPGTTSVTSSAVDRVVARIDAQGGVDTTTWFNGPTSGSSIRGAATLDGTSLWISGNGSPSSNGGVWHTTLGATSALQVLSSPSNMRWLGIEDGQLYGSSGSGAFVNVFTVGTGLPTTGGQTATSLTGMPTSGASPYGFVLFDLDQAVAGEDTLYVADDSSGGGLQKWIKDTAGTWSLSATFDNGIAGARSVAGWQSGSDVVLVVVTTEFSANTVARVTDDGSPNPPFTVVATAPADTVYRSVALAPAPAPALNETGVPAEADFCVLQFPPTLSATSGQPTAQVYGRIFETGVTETAGDSAAFLAQVGYGAAGSDPRSSPTWRWYALAFNTQVGNDDEYGGAFPAPTVSASTSYDYTVRFSRDQGRSWTFCDLDGAGSNTGLAFDLLQLGDLTVTP